MARVGRKCCPTGSPKFLTEEISGELSGLLLSLGPIHLSSMSLQRTLSHPSGHRSQELTFWQCRKHIYWGRWHHHCHRWELTPTCICREGLWVPPWPRCTHPVKRKTEVSSRFLFLQGRRLILGIIRIWGTSSELGIWWMTFLPPCASMFKSHIKDWRNPRRRRSEPSRFSTVIYLTSHTPMCSILTFPPLSL